MSDAFQDAWKIVKNDEGWFDDSRFPLLENLCENCEEPKERPEQEMCNSCMKRMLGVGY